MKSGVRIVDRGSWIVGLGRRSIVSGNKTGKCHHQSHHHRPELSSGPSIQDPRSSAPRPMFEDHNNLDTDVPPHTMEGTLTNAPQGCGFLTSLPENAFFPEAFVADERLMIETAEAFSRNEVLPNLERLEKQEDGVMLGLLRKAGELGFCGPDTPEAYGGLGLSKTLSPPECLSFLASTALSASLSASTVALAKPGSSSSLETESQKQQYLPRLAAAEIIYGAYALSEPDAGTDALSLTTKAIKSGDTYKLTGTKMWISNAKWADLFLVMAKVDGRKVKCLPR